MNEVEVVARAVAPMMEGGREFDQMPPTRIELRQWARSGMCSTNDATQDDATALAQAAIAALDAARGEAEPVAWLYGAPRRAPFKGFEARASHSRWPDWMQNGWTETPLYAHPPRGDRVARVVEWLRDCALSSAIPDDPAQMIADLADAIERGEPFNG